MPPSKYLSMSAHAFMPCPAMHLQLSVYVKSLVRLDLHLPDPLTGRHTIVNRRFELIAPRTPPTVSVAVVVAAQEVALGLRAFLGGERDIDRFKEVLFERRVQADNSFDVLLDVLGIEASEEVAGRC
jgi:hypothetical protein